MAVVTAGDRQIQAVASKIRAGETKTDYGMAHATDNFSKVTATSTSFSKVVAQVSPTYTKSE